MNERILILGGDGLLGHNLAQYLPSIAETHVSVRGSAYDYVDLNLAPAGRLWGWIDADYPERFGWLLDEVRPAVVINAIGLVKQRSAGRQWTSSLHINGLFPHILQELTEPRGIRLIHFSTDCVFSGKRGFYTEDDVPDPLDVYGKSKLVGEVVGPNTLTLRTSIIGWELKNHMGLLDWFAQQRGQVIHGYMGAIYSGLSAMTAARLTGTLITDFPNLSGLYHVASKPISKYGLLTGLQEALGWSDITIIPDTEYFCDRSLSPCLFESATGWKAPGWEEMVEELAYEFLPAQ